MEARRLYHVIHTGKACRYCQSEAGGRWESGGLSPEKIVRTTHSGTSENALLEHGRKLLYII